MKASELLWQFSQPENNPEALTQMDNSQIESHSRSNYNNQVIDKQLLVSEVNDTIKLTKNNYESINVAWDWQTSALVLAVCACIIFFIVAGCSAIIYVRQWRRMKRNFEPDRKRDTRVVIPTGWPEIGGNLYIEETAGESSSLSPASPINKSKQLKQIQRNIQNIIAQKSQFNC
ncbi:Similar to wgn: Tumor necrosis factor receptor superfamily member wengen (Drosophila melanogaster) [Cotesia congregata]|uniref:Similar to wgn: Tumor necrosis factor receptor superfamily member wengen (Drosophila melanogaster) n=1 Tax=Cotesia congregata TaxID=51543 RepID=A0A8J2H530_COTCN|nr:Similar to wgn: Tumor necrosis factor receptor superfamily member wengen (Drosophila melanogaster) [Cotesia congregata]